MDAGYDHLNRKMRSLLHCALYRTTLRISCRDNGCRHTVSWEAVRVWWRFQCKGWDDTLPGAENRFYCTKCWHGQQKVSRPRILITRDMPRECHLPYPDEREWQRVISRYRS